MKKRKKRDMQLSLSLFFFFLFLSSSSLVWAKQEISFESTFLPNLRRSCQKIVDEDAVHGGIAKDPWFGNQRRQTVPTNLGKT